MYNTPEQNKAFKEAFDSTNARFNALKDKEIRLSWEVHIVYNDAPNENAILKFDTIKEAEENKRAFINYGKCSNVFILQKVNIIN